VWFFFFLVGCGWGGGGGGGAKPEVSIDNRVVFSGENYLCMPSAVAMVEQPGQFRPVCQYLHSHGH